MYVHRLLAINMATFAALGTVLLALGEQNPTLAVVAVLAAMLAVWITDILGVFRLNRRVTNVAVLLAVLRSLWELFQIQGSVQVMAIANLLAYVMIILMFQEKDFRTWWHIALLSLLQVAASATFFQGIWFAPLLLLYFFLGLSALALLFLHHERTHYHQVRHHPIVPREARTLSERLGVNWRRLGKIAVATFVVGPVSLFLDYGEKDDRRGARTRPTPKDPGTNRWPLIHEEPEFTGSADNLGGRAGIGAEFYRHLAGLIPGTLVVAAVLFLLIPRFGRFDFSPFRWGRMSASRGSSDNNLTGFSDTIQLGSQGRLTEDPEEVLRVRFLQPNSEQTYPMQGNVYLRGALLNNYEQGKWEGLWPRWPSGIFPVEPEWIPRSGLVRQSITMQPSERQELFSIWPFVGLRRDPRIAIDLAHRRLVRSDNMRQNSQPYQLGTYAVVDGKQVALTPATRAVQPELRQLLQLPAAPLPELTATANRWMEQSELDESQVIERALFLESKFTDSEKFAYSLDGQLRETGIDPIEDFIKSSPSVGHCVYFASALALMLRTQGIPAQVVNGFVTNEYDSEGEFYRVRHRDAHSWVEVYIPPERLPVDRPFGHGDAQWELGGWLRLDPTPTRMAPSGPVSLAAHMESWFEWVQDSWYTYVVQMDRTRQQAVIYDPLKQVAAELKQAVVAGEGWKGLWRQVVELPGRLRALLADAGWFSWVGGILLLGALGAGYFTYRLMRFITRLAARFLPGRRSRIGGRAKVAFYRRLETLLARRGLRRRAGQTHREFALAAASHLTNNDGKRVESAAMFVTDAYYEVRFGDGRLDNMRMQAVEQALSELEQAAMGRWD